MSGGSATNECAEGNTLSIMGDQSAVVSLGISCQTYYQIRENVDVVREELGDASLIPQAFPLDGLICPPYEASALILGGSRFPSEHDVTQESIPRWRGRNIVFPHAFKGADNRYAVGETYGEVKQKFVARWRRFDRLTSVKYLLFVVSNTQNELGRQCGEYGLPKPTLRASEVNLLSRSLKEKFGNHASLLAITREDLFVSDAYDNHFDLHFHTEDESGWQGDSSPWRESLQAITRRMREGK